VEASECYQNCHGEERTLIKTDIVRKRYGIRAGNNDTLLECAIIRMGCTFFEVVEYRPCGDSGPWPERAVVWDLGAYSNNDSSEVVPDDGRI
jgi:hypothetical protein